MKVLPFHNVQKPTKNRLPHSVGYLCLFLIGMALAYNGLLVFPEPWTGLLREALSGTYVAFFMGMLATSILQSSSLSVLLIALFSAAGLGDLAIMIPAIIGANVGTIITITIEALGVNTSETAFRRAITTVLLQDFFKLLTALIVFPLESHFHILEKALEAITNLIDFSFCGFSLGDWTGQHAIFAFLGFGLVTIAMQLWEKRWLGWLELRFEEVFNRHAPEQHHSFFLLGFLWTLVLQSSALVIAQLVPRAMRRALTLNHTFPFLVGTNLGKTLLIFIGALVLPAAAMQVALFHLFFNLAGMLLFWVIRPMRQLPTSLAQWMGVAILRNRLLGFFYILTLFFVLPFLLILLG
ncbi:MAG: hypothetical protein AAF740_03580 [Bacteroidota bacterium]